MSRLPFSKADIAVLQELSESAASCLKQTEEALWVSHVAVFPDSERWPLQTALMWAEGRASSYDERLSRLRSIAEAAVYPAVVFFRTNVSGHEFIGYRFGFHPPELLELGPFA